MTQGRLMLKTLYPDLMTIIYGHSSMAEAIKDCLTNDKPILIEKVRKSSDLINILALINNET